MNGPPGLPRWLANPHLLTMVAALPVLAPRSSARPKGERLVLDLPSGRLLARAWWHDGACATVLVLPGVGGSMDSVHVLRASAALHRAGLHVVQVNVRGVGDGAEGA